MKINSKLIKNNIKNMPYGINYKQILNSLVVKPARAVLFFALCFCLEFGIFYFEYCLELVFWSLEFIYVLKNCGSGRLI